MSKCKEGQIWDSKIKECRTPTTNEKRIANRYKEDIKTAKQFGTLTGSGAGMVSGKIVGGKAKGNKSKLAIMAGSALTGALVGRYKAKKSVEKKYKKAGIDVPSRKIPKKNR